MDWGETDLSPENMASVRTLNVSSESLLITTVGNKADIGIVALSFGYENDSTRINVIHHIEI